MPILSTCKYGFFFKVIIIPLNSDPKNALSLVHQHLVYYGVHPVCLIPLKETRSTGKEGEEREEKEEREAQKQEQKETYE